MLLRLFLLFTIMPLSELWLLLWFSSLTSPISTFGLVVMMGILRAWLARKQGFADVEKNLTAYGTRTTAAGMEYRSPAGEASIERHPQPIPAL